MKQSHKNFLDDVLRRVMTSPHIQYYLDCGMVKTTTILWGSRYSEICDIDDVGYALSINDRYRIDVTTLEEIYEIIDYINTIMPIEPRAGTKPYTYANVYYHHHTKRHTTTK